MSVEIKKRSGFVGRGLRLLALVPLGLVVMANPAFAQAASPATYGGDLWSRPRLTGDWAGVRDRMAKHGVEVDVDLTGVGQDVATGGRERSAALDGWGDYTVDVDTGKLGLWPGGFFKLHAENQFGGNVVRDSGGLIPVNGYALFPAFDKTAAGVPNLTFTQFLSPSFGIFFGKIETLEGDANEFADYSRNKFLNIGFAFNMTSALFPASSLGGGIVWVPWKDATVSLTAIDPSGTPTESGLRDPFRDGVALGLEGRTKVQIFGLTGHQLAGFAWIDKTFTSLDQDPSNIAKLLLFRRFPRLSDPGPVLERILSRFFPGLLTPAAPLNVETHAWNFYYNFDQYVWSPAGKPDAGVGLFFRFGISDGKANPVKYHFNFGIGGKNVVPGRPRDTFGIGWSRAIFSDEFVPFLRDQLDLGLRHEDAVEAYYNFSLTNWFNVTADLQIIDPGLKKKLSSPATLTDVKTAVVIGLRANTRF